jgi:hypothetical protein
METHFEVEVIIYKPKDPELVLVGSIVPPNNPYNILRRNYLRKIIRRHYLEEILGHVVPRVILIFQGPRKAVIYHRALRIVLQRPPH